ncbi:MAG: aminopeptidase P family protein [Deltaproteobacteria bacterium]|nr:aminopeptidase P family protein [Deltaproteobacteria bacterium]
MDHDSWIKNHFESYSKSHGFIFTPKEEIQNRLSRLREQMNRKGIESLLVAQKMDFFYLSGTTQDGLLFLPLEGDPLVLVKREIGRARVESPLPVVRSLPFLSRLPELIREHSDKIPEIMGLEMDVLPVKNYFRLISLFPEIRFVDASEIIKRVRAVKSPFEITLMRKAGQIGQQVYGRGREFLKEGMTEIAFAGLLESEAKSFGHEGLLRVRSYNYEAYTWHVLSGVTGGIVSQSDSPMGGLGLSPAFPVGASEKVMKAHEPILVDFGICYHGYQVDETRMFSIGKLPKKFTDAYKACKEIHDAVLAESRPGVDCEQIFLSTIKLAENLGYSENFLGPPGLQTHFIAHGIGLELNEFPFLARGQAYPLEQGMTFALEPKIVFPGEGSVGLENTVVVAGQGCEILTPLEQEIFEV